MKAFVDPELCIGQHPVCRALPRGIPDGGTLAVAIPGDIPPDQVPLAVDAANACPVSAIRGGVTAAERLSLWESWCASA